MRQVPLLLSMAAPSTVATTTHIHCTKSQKPLIPHLLGLKFPSQASPLIRLTTFPKLPTSPPTRSPRRTSGRPHSTVLQLTGTTSGTGGYRLPLQGPLRWLLEACRLRAARHTGTTSLRSRPLGTDLAPPLPWSKA